MKIPFFINFKQRHNKNTTTKLVCGFSIIEIIIYLAIFTIISVVVINSFIVVLSSFSNARTNQDLLNSGSISMDRISHEIRQAKNIDIVNSTLNSNSGVLRLNDMDGTSYVQIEKNGNALDLYSNGVLVGNLLSQNIYLNKIIFNRISTANSEAVKIEMELQDSRSKTGKTETLYNTIILRGGY